MPPGAPQILGQPPNRPWFSLNFSEQQRLYGYGRKQGLSTTETESAYATGSLGSTRYQRGVVRGISSGNRPIERPGLFERSAGAQQRAMREARRHNPDVSPEQVDAWMREGSFHPFARKRADRTPARVVGRDPSWYRSVTYNADTGTPVGNGLDTPEVAQLRTDALYKASAFVDTERASGNMKADMDHTRERVMAMTPDQLDYYMRLASDEEIKQFAMEPPADLGDGTAVNVGWYH